MPADRDHRATTPDLVALRRHATEVLGFSEDDPVVRDIDRLRVHFNEYLYSRVQRVLATAEARRSEVRHFSDRVPPPGTFTGDIPIAVAPTPCGKSTPVLWDIFRIPLNTIVVGTPGAGKTHLVRRLLLLLASVAPYVRIIVFDPNRSYESTLGDPRTWLSIRWEDTRLNPFAAPPGLDARRWLAEAMEMLCRSELAHSKYVGIDRLERLYSQAKARAGAGSPFLPPSMLDLRDLLAAEKSRRWSKEQQYIDSLFNVLHGRIISTGNVFDCSGGMEEALTNTRVRISTEGLSPLESLDFYITSLIHYTYKLRLIAPMVFPPPVHTAIFIEEAQNILARRSSGNIPVYQEILLRGRAVGLGTVLVAQDISSIDPTVLSACSNLFLFAQTTGRNKAVCKELADLSAREVGLLGELEPGECFIRMIGHPTWPHPFLARIPHE